MKSRKRMIDGVEYNVTSGFESVEKGWYDVKIGVWASDVHVFVGSVEEMQVSAREKFKDKAQVVAMLESWGTRDCGEAYGGMNSCGSDYVIRLSKYCPCNMGHMLTLVHEGLHAAQRMLSDLGAEVNPTGSETLAYTHVNIVGKIMHKFCESVRNKSKGKGRS
jgi:hypothetical protein